MSSSTVPTGENSPDSPCPVGMRESGWILPSNQLDQYLTWLEQLFDEGFQSDRVSATLEAAPLLRHNDAFTANFQVLYQGRPCLLGVNITRIDASSLELSLCTSPHLADQVEWTIQRYFDEVA